MKKNKITYCVVNPETKTVVDQLDKQVPDIFNTYEVCDECLENTKCEECIVRTLLLDHYVIRNQPIKQDSIQHKQPKLFYQLKEKIEKSTNTNFHFDKLNLVTMVWIKELCDIMESKLIKDKEENTKEKEAYPSNWYHCTIHLNPDTGEMHSDGDHRVRTWIENKWIGNKLEEGIDKPNLECATNAELMDALRSRIETQSNHECKTTDTDKVRDERFGFSKDWLFNYSKVKGRNRD